MSDYTAVYAFLVLVMLIILLSRLDSRFGKIEKELNEIKKRMDDYLKAQQKAVADAAKSEEVVKVDEAVKPVETVKPTETVKPEELAEIPALEILQQEPVTEESRETLADENGEAAIEESRVVAAEEKRKVAAVAAENVAFETPKKKNTNYEKFIGENLFGKVGILIFVIGVGFFVKYAIDKDWINETFRTVLGFLTGAALLAVAERLQKKYRTFSSLLAGGAFAVFYLTVAIAYHYYHIFSQPVAFVILVSVTVFMSILAVVYNRRELAIISLVGGFLAPFIVSSGEGNYLVLFTYLSILNLGMFGLSIYKKWSELPIISFVFTYLITGIFILFSYSSGSTVVSRHLFAFVALFYFIFMLPVLSILRGAGVKKLNTGLVFVIIVNNFLYLLMGVVFLKHMGLTFKPNGLLSMFIAVVNLGLVMWLWKSRGEHKLLVYTLLGLVVTFVSITVPIQLDGNYVTLLWASEMVLLLWLYIKSKIRVYEYAAMVLVWLCALSFTSDVYDMIIYSNAWGTIFLNSSFATSLFVGLATGAFALMMERNRAFFSTARNLKYTFWNPLMLFASVAILYYTFMMEFHLHLAGAIRSGAMFLFTSASIFAVCYSFKNRFPIERHIGPYLLTMGANVFIYMMNIWECSNEHMAFFPMLMQWLAAAFVIANIYYVARRYYTLVGINNGFTVYLNIVATLLWLTMVRSFLWQIGVDEYSAGLSLSLSSAGFVQMAIGMRLHLKVMRMVSLATFGIVLVKLVLVDLWAMPTIGKIIVFIILGLILLILSFLYQKLRNVLFKDDEEEVN